MVMRDLPMLDSDREGMREQFEGFDEMTMEEFRQATRNMQDEILDTMNILRGARS